MREGYEKPVEVVVRESHPPFLLFSTLLQKPWGIRIFFTNGFFVACFLKNCWALPLTLVCIWEQSYNLGRFVVVYELVVAYQLLRVLLA